MEGGDRTDAKGENVGEGETVGPGVSEYVLYGPKAGQVSFRTHVSLFSSDKLACSYPFDSSNILSALLSTLFTVSPMLL